MSRHTLMKSLALCLVLSLSLAAAPSGAFDLGKLKDLGTKVLTTDTSSSANSASESEIVAAFKQALNIAAENAAAFLGQDGGYLDNPEVFIPMPDELSFLAKSARFLGMDETVDNFVASMNHAAEDAAGETVEVFAGALEQMTMEDAQGILEGEDDAATQYFKKTSEGDLIERIQPIISQSMESVGVTSYYNSLTQGVSSAASSVGWETSTLEEYVTRKAVDGLFLVMAQEEAEIRNDPVNWTTELLKKVFGGSN